MLNARIGKQEESIGKLKLRMETGAVVFKHKGALVEDISRCNKKMYNGPSNTIGSRSRRDGMERECSILSRGSKTRIVNEVPALFIANQPTKNKWATCVPRFSQHASRALIIQQTTKCTKANFALGYRRGASCTQCVLPIYFGEISTKLLFRSASFGGWSTGSTFTQTAAVEDLNDRYKIPKLVEGRNT
ncbi:hypothetical protein V1478_003970 [Vespula squamosa]|uniref:Uncharacterized protein n=1 Tax=Vespula squamosa TaxID=30214 RepID=A0ABD2BND4_VESSQ